MFTEQAFGKAERRNVNPQPIAGLNWYISLIYTSGMPKAKIAKLFRNGRSQAVRLPKEFRFDGDRVRVRRVKEGVLLEPMLTDPSEWFAEIDRLRGGSTFPSRAKQRKPPVRRYFD